MAFVTAVSPKDMFEIFDIVLMRKALMSSGKSKTNADPGSCGGGEDECDRDGKEGACCTWLLLCPDCVTEGKSKLSMAEEGKAATPKSCMDACEEPCAVRRLDSTIGCLELWVESV